MPRHQVTSEEDTKGLSTRHVCVRLPLTSGRHLAHRLFQVASTVQVSEPIPSFPAPAVARASGQAGAGWRRRGAGADGQRRPRDPPPPTSLGARAPHPRRRRPRLQALPWRRLLADRVFLRLYRAFHGSTTVTGSTASPRFSKGAWAWESPPAVECVRTSPSALQRHFLHLWARGGGPVTTATSPGGCWHLCCNAVELKPLRERQAHQDWLHHRCSNTR